MTTILLVLGGAAALSAGAALLVRGAARLAGAVGLSSLVIGLTVVAFGTSAPELAVTAKAAFQGEANLALGNIIGSNVFNVLCILGITSVVVPQRVDEQIFIIDGPAMLLASLALIPIVATGGRISRAEGTALLAGYVVYVGILLALGGATPS